MYCQYHKYKVLFSFIFRLEPVSPRNVTFLQIHQTSVTLSLNTSCENGNETEIQITVYDDKAQQNTTLHINDTEVAVSGLTGGTKYTMDACAVVPNISSCLRNIIFFTGITSAHNNYIAYTNYAVQCR